MNVDLFHSQMSRHLGAPEFATDDEAEDYALAHPYAIAVVVKKCIVVSTFFGKFHEEKHLK